MKLIIFITLAAVIAMAGNDKKENKGDRHEIPTSKKSRKFDSTYVPKGRKKRIADAVYGVKNLKK